MLAARAAGALSRRLGAGAGRTISGAVFLALASAPEAARVAASRRSVLVSGTNGKTTTTTLIATAAAALTTVASNSTGANLAAGVFGAVVDDPHADLAVLEVD